MNIEWLKTVCDPKRPITSEPFTIEVEGRKVAVATNGFVMPMIDGDYGFPAPPEGAESFHDVLKMLPKGDPVPFPLAEVRTLMPEPVVPEELPYCEKCDNEGEIECPECEGDGGGICTCLSCGDEHDVECEKCNDNGTVPCDCGRKQKPIRPIVRVRIGEGALSLATLACVVPHLPDEPAFWQQDRPDRAALLTVGEWRVLVMPLSPDPAATIHHTIELPAYASSADAHMGSEG